MGLINSNPDHINMMVLHVAAANGNPNIVTRLIGHGADINQRDEYGNTPLHSAISEGHHHIVILLIKAGADIHAVNKEGQNPLDIAISGDHKPIIVALIKAGVDVNKRLGKAAHPLEATDLFGKKKYFKFLTGNDVQSEHKKPTRSHRHSHGCNMI